MFILLYHYLYTYCIDRLIRLYRTDNIRYIDSVESYQALVSHSGEFKLHCFPCRRYDDTIIIRIKCEIYKCLRSFIIPTATKRWGRASCSLNTIFLGVFFLFLVSKERGYLAYQRPVQRTCRGVLNFVSDHPQYKLGWQMLLGFTAVSPH